MLPRPDSTLGGAPQENKGTIKSLPFFCLIIFLVYLATFLIYQKDERNDQIALANWYQQSGLFELEWENYISWLRISGQIAKSTALETAKKNNDSLTVFRAMAFDPSFERENRIRGDQYWNSDQRLKWEQTRRQFAERAGKLPSVRFGLNPQSPRPSTYLTWHFLHESLLQWLVALLVLVPFAWAIEGTIGNVRMGALWLGSGVIAALSYVAIIPSGYTSLIGSTALTSAAIGMYLGLFGLKKINFVYFHPKNKAIQHIALPAVILAPLWLLLPLYEFYGGSSAPHAWVAQVAALFAGAVLVQLARPSHVDEEAVDNGADNDGADNERQIKLTLTSAWTSMSALAFTDAESAFNKALTLSPGNFSALSGLYHLKKIHPDTDAFGEIAEKTLAAAVSNEGELRQQYLIYRDYRKRIDSVENLPDDIAIQLIIRLARLNEAKEAEEIAMSLYQRKINNALFENALTSLGQSFSRQNNEGKAGKIAAMADNLKKRQ